MFLQLPAFYEFRTFFQEYFNSEDVTMQQGFSPFLRLPQDLSMRDSNRSGPMSYFRVEFFKYAEVETMVFLGAFVLASAPWPVQHAIGGSPATYLGTVVHAPASVSWPLRLPTVMVTASCPSLPELSGPNSCLYRPSVCIGGITGAGKINSGKQCAMEIWFCICNHIYYEEDYSCFEFSTDRHSLPLPWSHLAAPRKPFGPVGQTLMRQTWQVPL